MRTVTDTNTVSIRFKAKQTLSVFDDVMRFRMPADIQPHHYVDAHAWRTSQRFGSLFNSQLMPAYIRRELERAGIKLGSRYSQEELPDCVTVEPGFLCTVTITFDANKH